MLCLLRREEGPTGPSAFFTRSQSRWDALKACGTRVPARTRRSQVTADKINRIKYGTQRDNA